MKLEDLKERPIKLFSASLGYECEFSFSDNKYSFKIAGFIANDFPPFMEPPSAFPNIVFTFPRVENFKDEVSVNSSLVLTLPSYFFIVQEIHSANVGRWKVE